MSELNRRTFLAGAGAVAAAAGTAGLIDAPPAAAANITGTITDVIQDQGGEVFNVMMPAYGAKGDGSTDDTVAILNALQAAQSAGGGTLFFPPGVYLIKGASNTQPGGGQIEFSGAVGILGAGTNTSGGAMTGSSKVAEGNSVFLCGDATAGIRVVGTGTFRGFMVDGNAIATAPLQHGKLVSGVAQATGGATFISVWVQNSVGNGFTIYGAQNSSYHDCRSRINKGDGKTTGDGVYIDGGAGGLAFWHWEESDNILYGVHADKLIPGGSGTYGDHTEDIHFYGGICDGSSNAGVGKMKLVGTTNWSFPGLSIVGNGNISGSTIVLDQSSGYGLDFSGTWIWGNSNDADIDIQNAGPTSGTPRTFLMTDDVFWYNGGGTVKIEGLPGINRYTGRGWMYDNSAATGPAGGPDGDTLLIGRTGPWVTPSPAPGWSSSTGFQYRINSDGVVQFKGSNSSTNGTATTMFTLDPGYRPDHTLVLPVYVNNSVSYMTITSAGVVSVAGVGLLQSVFIDGASFPVR